LRKQSQGERVNVAPHNEGPGSSGVAADFYNEIDPEQKRR
jgi:hypothetical protein